MSNYLGAIVKEYEQIRSTQEKEKNERIREVYNVIPRIREIDTAIQELGLKCTRLSLNPNHSSNKDTIETIKQSMLSLKQEKVHLLKKHLYPIDYLEIQYECSLCKDTGYINTDKCICFKQRIIQNSYQQSNLGKVLDKENFSTFNINLFSDQKYNKYVMTPKQNKQNILSTC